MNLMKIFERFSTQDAAREYLTELRWPNGVTCPRCGCDHISELKSRHQYTCLDKNCRYRFSVTSDTVLHSTKLDLRKWLAAICMIVNAKKSVSSCQLARDLDISVKRAWHLGHRIREAMAGDPSQAELFSGIVQIDDYYHGGKPRPEDKRPLKRGRGTKKQPVLGVVEAKTGKAKTAITPNLKGKTIVNAAGHWFDLPNTELHSDEHGGYLRLGRLCKPHKVVNHNDWYVAEDGTNTNLVDAVVAATS